MKIQKQFTEVITLIRQARFEAFKLVNTTLIDLYWNIGHYISQRTENEGWGKSTVQQLAGFIQSQEPGLKGFSDKNLWRMKQFYETYKDFPKLSSLLRETNWTNNLIIHLILYIFLFIILAKQQYPSIVEAYCLHL